MFTVKAEVVDLQFVLRRGLLIKLSKQRINIRPHHKVLQCLLFLRCFYCAAVGAFSVFIDYLVKVNVFVRWFKSIMSFYRRHDWVVFCLTTKNPLQFWSLRANLVCHVSVGCLFLCTQRKRPHWKAGYMRQRRVSSHVRSFNVCVNVAVCSDPVWLVNERR